MTREVAGDGEIPWTIPKGTVTGTDGYVDLLHWQLLARTMMKSAGRCTKFLAAEDSVENREGPKAPWLVKHAESTMRKVRDWVRALLRNPMFVGALIKTSKRGAFFLKWPNRDRVEIKPFSGTNPAMSSAIKYPHPNLREPSHQWRRQFELLDRHQIGPRNEELDAVW